MGFDKGKFLQLFKVKKPIMAMVHLKGGSDEEKLAIAKREIDQYAKNGVDAVIIENYFGNSDHVEEVLKYMRTERKEMIYGVNVLNDDASAFELANKYDACFIQLDSVAGHLTPEDDVAFHDFIVRMRKETQAFVLGGVRFKYQPYLSGRSLEEDLQIGMTRCDAIVVTGEGTGMVTDLEKIAKFRSIMGNDFPLIVGAGVTAENAKLQLDVADAAIVGSYLKDTHKDDGDVCEEHVQKFMAEIEKLR
ncbi:UNVERIFIED_CONTAM: putative TIM-barrel enzyme [Brevibacillus sp. OAP136]